MSEVYFLEGLTEANSHDVSATLENRCLRAAEEVAKIIFAELSILDEHCDFDCGLFENAPVPCLQADILHWGLQMSSEARVPYFQLKLFAFAAMMAPTCLLFVPNQDCFMVLWLSSSATPFSSATCSIETSRDRSMCFCSPESHNAKFDPVPRIVFTQVHKGKAPWQNTETLTRNATLQHAPWHCSLAETVNIPPVLNYKRASN